MLPSTDTEGQKYEDISSPLRNTNRLLGTIKDRETGKTIAGLLGRATALKMNKERNTLLT